MRGSPCELSEELVTYEERKKGWRMNCDVGEVREMLENELITCLIFVQFLTVYETIICKL